MGTLPGVLGGTEKTQVMGMPCRTQTGIDSFVQLLIPTPALNTLLSWLSSHPFASDAVNVGMTYHTRLYTMHAFWMSRNLDQAPTNLRSSAFLQTSPLLTFSPLSPGATDGWAPVFLGPHVICQQSIRRRIPLEDSSVLTLPPHLICLLDTCPFFPGLQEDFCHLLQLGTPWPPQHRDLQTKIGRRNDGSGKSARDQL